MVAQDLPPGFGVDWAGQSLQEEARRQIVCSTPSNRRKQLRAVETIQEPETASAARPKQNER